MYAMQTLMRIHKEALMRKKLLKKLKNVAHGRAVMNIIVKPYCTAASA
jgi:hypothetical protein